ncbi:hypothetical protein AAFF_G00431360 [Aldrovandia affinis]|uniref:Glucokinase regulatory protein second SIS domain-containing protein n=1 Tax=Aldrovandia affinis TaxID=143900 RepID=A0AAD7S8U2_9TELE|nr:hypothetical protein AAFF_G00431360 [Aldrovandia affinis]
MKDVFASVMSFVWPSGSSEDDSCLPMMLQAELCTKWILNAVSTGAHILKGKIYRNYMMDLKVTNSKLFRRAISLLQAIYGTEQPTKEMNTAALNQHTHIANTSSRVVPTALVMLRWSCSLGEARKRLSAHSLIKDAVEACLATSTNRRTTDTTAVRAQTTTT